MRTQIFDRLKKRTVILLLVLFVVSVTVAAASAATDISKFGPNSKKAYARGYIEGSNKGYNAGYVEGISKGNDECQNGETNSGGTGMKGDKVSISGAAYDLGEADGYNDGYGGGYIDGYNDGYDACVGSSGQNWGGYKGGSGQNAHSAHKNTSAIVKGPHYGLHKKILAGP